MTIDLNDEIVQDFLVEGGEILEQLGEQLVDLESRSNDQELLNAVFRGFHTIKGGAGFIAAHGMVEVCHKAEDTFNLLRQGEREVDVKLMDVMLRVLDVVSAQFDEIRSGVSPSSADAELMTELTALSNNEALPEKGGQTPIAATPADTGTEPAGDVQAVPKTVETVTDTPKSASNGANGDDITDEEFEELLDVLAAEGGTTKDKAAEKKTAAPAQVAGENMTEDEFEHLLDELHGQGRHSDAVGTPVAEGPAACAPAVKGNSDEITADEFESLLDDLHGKGHGPKGLGASPPVAASPAKATAAKVAAPNIPKKPKPAPRATAPKPPAESTVRVDTGVLDRIMNMVGELVLVRNRMATLESSLADEEVAKAVGNLDVVTSDLQSAVMQTRMQPIRKVFGRFPRVVRDLARSLKKEVNLEMVGEETDLDKNLVEALADPMVHLVRNAMDHGIESPEERELADKPRTGTIVLSAEQEGDHILLKVTDDGKGMDPDALRRKAVDKGMMDQEAAGRLDDHDCFNLIFAAGFSTKTEISDVSGRGVGMDVVKTRISQLNGSVDIDSELGKGSCVLIKVPLTLAIVPTLMVNLGTQIFALPLVNVQEIFDLDLTKTKLVDGQRVILVRGRPLPLFYLSQWLVRNAPPSEATHGHVVIVHVGTRMLGFVVDQLIGQEEVVIKPLGAMLHGTKGLAGATITGDGRIALILDVPGLVTAYARRGLS